MIRVVFFWLLLSMAAFAVEPDEMLADPVLEARAQALDDQIRCVKCQSESIASSNAEWAKTARLIVRERLDAGDTDAEVMTYFVERYGEYVRMQPRFGGATVMLWLAGPLLLFMGIGIAVYAFRPVKRQPDAELSDEEKAKLEALLRE